MQPVLELKGLWKSFGGLQAMRDVTLRDHAGRPPGHHRPERRRQDHAVQSDHRHFPATSGQVLLFGQDVTNWPSHRRTALGMARTFQVTSLFPKLTVLDNVLLAIEGLHASKFVMWRF